MVFTGPFCYLGGFVDSTPALIRAGVGIPEAILIRIRKQILSVFIFTFWLSPAAFSKEDAHDLLAKSFQQDGIWTQGPVKLTAKVRLPRPDGGDDHVDYTISWAGPDKWRTEWSAQGLQQIAVLNDGKLSFVTNQKTPLLWAIMFGEALADLDGGNPAGPYTVAPPSDWQKAKLDVSKSKINGIDARCVAFGQPVKTLCSDPASAHLLSAESDFTTFEYGDYVSVGGNSYPQIVRVSFNKQVLSEGKLTITRGEKFADSLFAPPDKSTTVDIPSCADVGKNFTAPHLDKAPAPKMPEAARKAKKYGVVWVLLNVGKDGAVAKAEVLGGDPDLSAAASDAAQQYRFSPYTRCGQPVEFRKLVVVQFAPPAQGPPEISVSPR
jgi:TonB family protein